ncbi:2-amino-4-hydroxy-6-hydroxymethyldihydropteridine diphosphokinase [Gilliamella sp. Fer1-1]|jgi:2-amino-4-hydroxy-6-hydroxymethyldihydropteridine diphosphokinase|uniref:2-amino-4-hydroxy-6- hydroxymethyldihydropteridine diphosphokinase n=1 Tax=unclassified Gilliamella TaxID=2685620 RepID=UPI00080DA28A|nr:2-amino-4-hydroxy-6-hydroxymethyldihydropteridine diphosphokinase [Gilliamella apicola]OCG19445.1 2-amino-4-hydroxy-6-hydroxymethyldihydropteridine diphosphokinase [Gilliamella apicola]OCG40625.1 2-amino-4-hydroxy-6-hydroxymethyldihydropteridine diphosphokinase [Gilliamella apicola]OCG44069.1 2-amino-4-hydroxy-6-hydroxymethyldihydropteridine diphosphokinase [Gilliamella apicola]OCG56896.1 2-amino-4-hydroxy-6-hydroxymethyldihydropteridine diphosphokinase [Gilliamella apicola]OCG78707.1 2-ami
MSTCYIALGSNLEDPLAQANRAIVALKQLPNTKVADISPFYRSKPLGPQNQNDYLNAVIKLTTNLSPIELLDELQTIEKAQGRVRKDNRWGARTLDLDILLYDDLVINSERLTIPHYHMKNREFVLYPLFDISPELILPDNDKLYDLVTRCPKNELTKWDK